MNCIICQKEISKTEYEKNYSLCKNCKKELDKEHGAFMATVSLEREYEKELEERI